MRKTCKYLAIKMTKKQAAKINSQQQQLESLQSRLRDTNAKVDERLGCVNDTLLAVRKMMSTFCDKVSGLSNGGDGADTVDNALGDSTIPMSISAASGHDPRFSSPSVKNVDDSTAAAASTCGKLCFEPFSGKAKSQSGLVVRPEVFRADSEMLWACCGMITLAISSWLLWLTVGLKSH